MVGNQRVIGGISSAAKLLLVMNSMEIFSPVLPNTSSRDALAETWRDLGKKENILRFFEWFLSIYGGMCWNVKNNIFIVLGDENIDQVWWIAPTVSAWQWQCRHISYLQLKHILTNSQINETCCNDGASLLYFAHKGKQLIETTLNMNLSE